MARAPSGTIRTGLVGEGISGSRSPALHEEEAAALGLSLTYERFDLADPAARFHGLAEVIDHVEAEGFAGVNITFPFKQAVIPLLDELSSAAERLAAVNTVVFRGGRRIGHNTDWYGFGESFRRGLADVARDQVLQLGAGGAGAAVAYALLDSGVKRLAIFDLDAGRARDLAEKMAALFPDSRTEAVEDVAAAMPGADGLVNATPIGMASHPGAPAPLRLLRPSMWVADIVYVPLETELLRAARKLNCRTLDGGGMVVFQAAEAFRLFTGRDPDAARMRRRFLESVSEEGDGGRGPAA